jgi:hypothetical protein
VCVYVCVCARRDTYMRTCVHTYIHTYIHVFTSTHLRATTKMSPEMNEASFPPCNRRAPDLMLTAQATRHMSFQHPSHTKRSIASRLFPHHLQPPSCSRFPRPHQQGCSWEGRRLLPQETPLHSPSARHPSLPCLRLFSLGAATGPLVLLSGRGVALRHRGS